MDGAHPLQILAALRVLLVRTWRWQYSKKLSLSYCAPHYATVANMCVLLCRSSY